MNNQLISQNDRKNNRTKFQNDFNTAIINGKLEDVKNLISKSSEYPSTRYN